MKLSLLLRSLIIPFLMFALLGINCPGEDDEPDVCNGFKTSVNEVKRLKDGILKNTEVTTSNARAECDVRFLIKYGWDYPQKFTSSGAGSPLKESLVDLKFTLGDAVSGKTFNWQEAGPVSDTNPDGKPGFVWFIDLPLSAIADEGNAQYFVKIQHDLVDEEFDVFVDVTIEYASEF